MEHIRLNTVALLGFAINCAISLGQQASINGVVKDREDKSPIRGAEVKVGAKVLGITGVDGKYVVSNLPRGSRAEVTYTKQGYGAKTEQIILKDERTQEDVALFKNTTDAAYWSSWSDMLRKDVQAQGSDSQSQSEQYAHQWKEVEEAGLTEEAKRAAARQLWTVFPSQSAVPTDLLAYAQASQVRTVGDKEQIAQEIEENTNRFTALSEYDVKGEATVKFNVGSSTISANQEQLNQVAQTATGLTGYIVEVTGYADSTGSAAMNTKLSEERAKAVVTYLMQQGNVPIRHIVTPSAMGTIDAAAPNETAQGRAENRRVEVKVLVNRGMAGGPS